MEEVADWLWNLEGDRHRRLGPWGVFVFFFISDFDSKKGRLFAESSSFKSNSIEVLVKYVFLHIFFLWQLWSQKDGLKTFIRLFFTNQCFYQPGTLTFCLDETKGIVPRETRPEAKAGFFRYVQAFKENLIDGMSLETLTLGDLKELGVTELRNRKVGDEDCWRMEGGSDWCSCSDFLLRNPNWFLKIDNIDLKKIDEAFYFACCYVQRQHIRSLQEFLDCLARLVASTKIPRIFHQSDCVKVLDPPKGIWIDCLTHWIWSQICGYSCWWKKSCTTWDVETLVNNGWCSISSINSPSFFQPALFFELSCSDHAPRDSEALQLKNVAECLKTAGGFCRLLRVCRAHPEKLRHVASFRTWLWLKLAKDGKN